MKPSIVCEGLANNWRPNRNNLDNIINVQTKIITRREQYVCLYVLSRWYFEGSFQADRGHGVGVGLGTEGLVVMMVVSCQGYLAVSITQRFISNIIRAIFLVDNASLLTLSRAWRMISRYIYIYIWLSLNTCDAFSVRILFVAPIWKPIQHGLLILFLYYRRLKNNPTSYNTGHSLLLLVPRPWR